MDILVPEREVSVLADQIDRAAHADYVYMYPPRQAYRQFTEAGLDSVAGLVASSLARESRLNLYVHVPFCHQICSFCNLYATNAYLRDMQKYVSAVINEVQVYEQLTDKKDIATIYLGGGTPSLLAPKQVEELITALLQAFSSAPTVIPAETALEVDPATLDLSKLRALRSSGVNRINLGYQSMVATEVAQIGRKRSPMASLQLLEGALGVGFSNVCVDLIYGLRDQTDESWAESVAQVAAIGPETICAYALTLRPYTGYHKRGYQHVDGEVLYRRYDMAHEILSAAGYARETHVRWVRERGGYVQKANHWNLQNVLGFGAGARSYLWDVDLRNGYSVRRRRDPLDSYMERSGQPSIQVSDGYVMSHEERMRKAAVLNVTSLDRAWFNDLFGQDPLEAFESEYHELLSTGICEINESHIFLTEAYYNYRDLVSQYFFSPEVRQLVSEFDYNE
jgi:oxygen-independent coproporphyrinogen III oxidase